jgi:hypothetical protein
MPVFWFIRRKEPLEKWSKMPPRAPVIATGETEMDARRKLANLHGGEILSEAWFNPQIYTCFHVGGVYDDLPILGDDPG